MAEEKPDTDIIKTYLLKWYENGQIGAGDFHECMDSLARISKTSNTKERN